MWLAGLGGGVLGEGNISGDLDKGHFITAALLLYGTRRIQVVEKSVARHVGERLASGDPAVLQPGVNAVATSQRLMNDLRVGGKPSRL
jgi:hypothetical protein